MADETSERQRFSSEFQDGVATFRFERPDILNAMDAPNLARLCEQLENAGRDAAVRSLIITGSGRAFSTGHDLRQVDNVKFGRDAVRLWNPLFLTLQELPKPVVAAINGTAVGAGLNLALACDLVYACDEAMLGESFVWIGASPDTGAHLLLQRAIGTARAAEILYLGRKFSGREAAEIGLVVRSFPTVEALQDAARAAAEHLARGPTIAYGVIKRGLRLARQVDFATLLEWEADQEEIVTQSEDFREGVGAFLQKRKAHFVGR
jgi:2-(1,2-epoxy-1,2-dihydrophenyl)acetyl-CoA isomerase